MSSTPAFDLAHGSSHHLLAPSSSSCSLASANILSSRPRSASPRLPSQAMAEQPPSRYQEDPPVQSPPTSTAARPVQSIGTQVSAEQLTNTTKAAPHAGHGGDADRLPSSLAGLCALLRSEKHQSQKSRSAESRLYQLHLATTRASRLAHIARSAQRTLAECIRSEDKLAFVSLFNSFQEALSSTPKSPSRITGEQCDPEFDGLDDQPSFLDALPDEVASGVKDFLHKVKYDSSFLNDRLAALNHRELVDLLPEKAVSKSSESVFSSSQYSNSHTSRNLEYVVDSHAGNLSSGSYASPLETLILSVRGSSSGALKDDPIATDVWASVCAKLISEQRPGSEKLVPAIVDLWAAPSRTRRSNRLERWVLETLQNGAFLLEKPMRATFQMRMEGRYESGVDEMRREAFIADAANSLLDLLGAREGSTILPDGALKMCAAIHDKLGLSPGYQYAFPSFIVTRWLVTSFLPGAVTLPEMYNIAADHFISEHARHRILREVAIRAQRAILDVIYSWKLGNRSSPETVTRVGAILQHFQSKPHSTQNHVTEHHTFGKSRTRENNGDFVAISSTDIFVLVNALYPERSAVSLASEPEVWYSGLQSSASSISGFSLFKVPTLSDQLQTLSPFSPQDAPAPTETANSSSETPQPITDAGIPTEHSQADPLERQVKEARAIIGDIMAAGNQTEESSWVLLFDEQKGQFTSFHDRLESVTGNSTYERTSRIRSSQYLDSKAAIEDLLVLEANESYCTALLDSQAATKEPWSKSAGQLTSAFQQCIESAQDQSDFLTAHLWFQRSQSLDQFLRENGHAEALNPLLDDIAVEARDSSDCSARRTAQCNEWFEALQSAFIRTSASLAKYDHSSRSLRDKMWYVADVRTSSAYDETRLVASALHIMGKPKAPPRARTALPVRHTNGIKATQSNFHLKTEAQILELLSATPNHGGPNKLSDDQTRALSQWMENNNVENLCQGEERLQKLCMQMRKCIDLLVDDLSLDNAPLWSNSLFARDRRAPLLANGDVSRDSNSTLGRPASRFEVSKKFSSGSVNGNFSFSRPASCRSSVEAFESRSPTWTTKSSAPFWSPANTEAQAPSTVTSAYWSQAEMPIHPRQHNSQRAVASPVVSERSLGDQLQRHLTSLLLSDFVSTVFYEGSETDKAFWTGLGGELTNKHFRETSLSASPFLPISSTRFDFTTAFRISLQKFSLSYCPMTKLRYLHNIDNLLEQQVNASRTDLTSVGDASRPSLRLSPLVTHLVSPASDVQVDGFRRLFSDSSIRPAAIFRDLQLIAAMVPSHILETSSEGKSFWNAVIAISGLRQEARNMMVETADSIIAYHSNNRGHGRTSSAAQKQRDSAAFSVPARTPSAEDVGRYTMADAGSLLQIAAKERDAVAQRELATLYLTHPDLMDRIIAPFARPRDVFKEELESKWRKNQDPTRCDPMTMCVAHHWMALSSKGGDPLAKEYLRQREEMERLP